MTGFVPSGPQSACPDKGEISIFNLLQVRRKKKQKVMEGKLKEQKSKKYDFYF